MEWNVDECNSLCFRAVSGLDVVYVCTFYQHAFIFFDVVCYHTVVSPFVRWLFLTLFDVYRTAGSPLFCVKYLGFVHLSSTLRLLHRTELI